jgi:hypothetical protein
MHEVSGLRLLRVLRGKTLQDVANGVDCQRSHISEVERTTDCGRKLKKRLVEFHGAPWSLLSKRIDASKIADAIVSQATTKKETRYAS